MGNDDPRRIGKDVEKIWTLLELIEDRLSSLEEKVGDDDEEDAPPAITADDVSVPLHAKSTSSSWPEE